MQEIVYPTATAAKWLWDRAAEEPTGVALAMIAKRRRDGLGCAKKAQPDLAFDPIEAALRQIHDSIASEEIPDDFLRLLEQLDALETKRGPS